MKALITIAVALAIFLPSQAFPEDLGTLRTTLVERDVYLYTEDVVEWFEARENFPLREGDAIWAAEGSRAEVYVRGGTYVRLDEFTLLDVLVAEDDNVRLFLREGRVYINNERNERENIRIESSRASVSVRAGAVVMYDVAEGGAARVSVLKGHAYVQGASGSMRLGAGSSALIGEELFASVSTLGAPDAWERWNRDMDDRLRAPYASARYLPDELHEYAYDFDEYGRWYYVSDYGYVWRPSISVSISLGWAPYKHGRWRWVRGNYVWISYERWGWAPYHYGRWTYVRTIGWCWVPPPHLAVYWGPGYVGWVYTSDYVAWVPLAPGEIYYGYGYYGPGTVNIVDIDIKKVVIKTTYKNAGVKDSVTTVHRDTFLTGKEKEFRPRRNPFAAEKPALGPPDFKPERPERGGRPAPSEIDRGKRPGATIERGERGAPERPERIERPEPPDVKERPSIRPEAPAREAPTMRPAFPTREAPAARPEPPGRDIERRAPERAAPEDRGTVERPEPPRRGAEPREEVSPGAAPERERERVITPERPSPPGRQETPSPSRTREAPSPATSPAERGAPKAAPSAPATKGVEKGGPAVPSAPAKPGVEVAPAEEELVEEPGARGRDRGRPSRDTEEEKEQ